MAYFRKKTTRDVCLGLMVGSVVGDAVISSQDDQMKISWLVLWDSNRVDSTDCCCLIVCIRKKTTPDFGRGLSEGTGDSRHIDGSGGFGYVFLKPIL